MAIDRKQSVELAAEKARALRVTRLESVLATKLENPIAAIDALMSEAALGDPRLELWEQLHQAAMRDGLEDALSDAYAKCIAGPRMKRLPTEAQVAVLIHAADFAQGIRGDMTTTEELLEKVIAIDPSHRDAFMRLEKRLEKILDPGRLIELYAAVAATPPRKEAALAAQVLDRLLPLGTKAVVSDEACKKLLAYVPANAKVLDALEAHCKTTGRAALACELLEAAVAAEMLEHANLVAVRHRLVKAYLGEVGQPARAIDHVEALLQIAPRDDVAFKAAERLLSTPEVSSRAAAAMAAARRARGSMPPLSGA